MHIHCIVLIAILGCSLAEPPTCTGAIKPPGFQPPTACHVPELSK